MLAVKSIALVAHDNRKEDLVQWVEWNYNILLQHKIVCTGTTGRLVEKAVEKKLTAEGKSTQHFEISKLRSGPS